MKTHRGYPLLEINMLPRLWLETQKSVVLDKKSEQNSILKAFIGLQGWAGLSAFLYFPLPPGT